PDERLRQPRLHGEQPPGLPEPVRVQPAGRRNDESGLLRHARTPLLRRSQHALLKKRVLVRLAAGFGPPLFFGLRKRRRAAGIAVRTRARGQVAETLESLSVADPAQ